MIEEEIDQCFEFIKELSKRAGEVFKEGFYGEKIVTEKGVSWDLVTNYDTRIEELLIGEIKGRYPNHLFIAEESAHKTKSKLELTDAPTWIIDPIDGTTNFIHGLPLTCISIALAVGKELVIGIIYNPIINEFFSARKGKGAFFNEKKMSVSKETELGKSLIQLDVGLMMYGHRLGYNFPNFDGIIGMARGIRTMGSAALSLANVARGSIDGYVCVGLQSWDVAAGVLLIQEAGGCLTSLKGTEFDLFARNVVATGTANLGHAILENLAEAAKEKNERINYNYPLDRIL